MNTKWCWCSKELEPDFLDCSKCPFGEEGGECSNSFVFHADAVKFCDEKRQVRGLPLIFDNFDLMRENFKRKEIAEQNISEKSHQKPSELIKQEAIKDQTLQSYQNDRTPQTLLCGIGICILLGFPMAYFGQIFQIFTEFIFGMFSIFFSPGPHSEVWSETVEDSFFYADFPNRYLYWTSLMIMVWSWMNYDQRIEVKNMELYLRIGSVILFMVVALFNLNLFVSSIFGPFFIVLGLLLTAKRR